MTPYFRTLALSFLAAFLFVASPSSSFADENTNYDGVWKSGCIKNPWAGGGFITEDITIKGKTVRFFLKQFNDSTCRSSAAYTEETNNELRYTQPSADVPGADAFSYNADTGSAYSILFALKDGKLHRSHAIGIGTIPKEVMLNTPYKKAKNR